MSLSSASHIDSQEQRVDAIFRPYTSSNAPGMAVGVVRNGKLVFARGYGAGDIEKQTAITPQTNLRLASVTKQFTATAIMLLVHDGKLGYDDSLAKVFPEFPAYGSAITIRHLLNHTSGLKDYEDLYAARYKGVPSGQIPQIHDDEVLKIMESQASGDFAPGSRWRYSNSGYSVLAMAVERVSGMKFQDFLAKRIFGPAGMTNTLAYVKGVNEVPKRAFGYRLKQDGGWVFADQSSTSAVLGDGGVYSSVDDLVKWDAALRAHSLMSAEEMAPAITPVRAPGVVGPEGQPEMYGFGWFLDPYKGHRRMWHYGETSGFLTAFERFPDDDLTVIVLANRTDQSPQQLALRVADLYLNQ